MKVSEKLIPVPLRDVFQNEAYDFTPWLAKEPNLEELAETLGMDELELEAVEVSVGPYYADIVATEGDDRIVIENQLNKTDHDHLGKVLTYAAGLQARAIIWIAERFTEEHRRTVDFLNEVTTDDLRVFGIEMRLYRIANSPPAPQFHVVARPNDYLRSVTTRKGSHGPLTDTKQNYLRFWTVWNEYANKHSKRIRPRKPRPQHWMHHAIGRAKFKLGLSASTSKERLSCDIYLAGSRARDAFAALQAQREELEAQLGPLEWIAHPGKNDCRIAQYKKGIDVSNESVWPEAHAWMLKHAERFYDAFHERIRTLELPPDDLDDDEDLHES